MSGGGEGGEGEAAAKRRGRRGEGVRVRCSADAATARPRWGFSEPRRGIVQSSGRRASRTRARGARERGAGGGSIEGVLSRRIPIPRARVSLASTDDSWHRAASPSTAAEDDDAVTTRDSPRRISSWRSAPRARRRCGARGTTRRRSRRRSLRRSRRRWRRRGGAMAAAERTRLPPRIPRRPRLDPADPDRRTCSGTASRTCRVPPGSGCPRASRRWSPP